MKSQKLVIRRLLTSGLILFAIGTIILVWGIVAEILAPIWLEISYILFVVFPGSVILLASFILLFIGFNKRYEFFTTIKKSKLDDESKLFYEEKRKRGNKISVIVTLSLIALFISVPLLSISGIRIHNRNVLYSNSEIAILKDTDFEKRYSIPGSGTKDDPYRIENLVIETDKLNGLYIKDISKYFIIRNCSVKALERGIVVYDCNPNIGTIHNNSIEITEGACIEVARSNGIHITYNLCLGSRNPYIWTVGIWIINTASCVAIGNNCSFMKSGMRFEGKLDNTVIIGNICNSNSGTGIFLSNHYGYNYVFDNYNIEITNNECRNNSYGILVGGDFDTPLLKITGNNCSYNSYCGIDLGYGSYEVSYNFIRNNTIGLSMRSINNSTISNNNFIANIEFGVLSEDSSWFYTENIRIYLNNFISNNILGDKQAKDSSYGTVILWYNNLTNIGNYWSDLIWNENATYAIDGGTNVDLYPLENPVSF